MKNEKLLCKLCGKQTSCVFNINFKAVSVCEECGDAITLQNITDLVVNDKRCKCKK